MLKKDIHMVTDAIKKYLIMASLICCFVFPVTGCVKNGGVAKKEGDKKEVRTETETEIEESIKGETYAVEGRELAASAKDEEEALEIAGIYGIELVEYSLGVAVFHTEEDPLTVINRGKGKDWPVLSINSRGTAFKGDDR